MLSVFFGSWILTLSFVLQDRVSASHSVLVGERDAPAQPEVREQLASESDCARAADSNLVVSSGSLLRVLDRSRDELVPASGASQRKPRIARLRTYHCE